MIIYFDRDLHQLFIDPYQINILG